MKIKKFKNLWTMGLIIFGVILVAFYIVKLVCPNFIIGVTEHPGIVAFGNYVDSNKWAYFLFLFAYGYIGGYFYCCACCRKYKLSLINNLLLIAMNIILPLLAMYDPMNYTTINYLVFILCPFLMNLFDKNLSKETFISTVTCYSVDIMSQLLSLFIRNIVIMSLHPNTATSTILLIDLLIWRVLLYCFFNFKRKEG